MDSSAAVRSERVPPNLSRGMWSRVGRWDGLVILVCIPLVFSSGCASYPVRLTTYLSHEVAFPEPGSNACIGIVIKSEPEEPLLEAEVRRKVEWLLEQRGYAVGAADDCDHLLTAFVAIDSGTTAIDSYPVYHPGRTITTRVHTHRGEWMRRTTHLPGRTSYVHRRYTIFTSHLGLTLYQRKRWLAASGRDLAEAVGWRSIATGSSESSDLRQAVDYLLVATFEHFGDDTGRQIRRTLRGEDDRVEALRRGARVRGERGSSRR